MTTEIVLMWVALTGYAVATALYVFGVVFSKGALTRWALIATTIGLGFQTASLALRWVRLGHGPYLGFYEVANALVFAVVAFFVVVAWRNRSLNTVGIAVMPLAILLLGGSMLSSNSGIAMTAKLASYWLFIHVLFANLAFGAFAISFGCAVIWIVRHRSKDGAWAKRFEKLPGQKALETTMVQFVLIGFFFWAIMIATGAIWADEAWGNYWTWDPIETWSLIVWLIYAAFLHVRYTLRWSGERLAWFAIIALPLALFALIGIPFAFGTPHAGIGGLGKDL